MRSPRRVSRTRSRLVLAVTLTLALLLPGLGTVSVARAEIILKDRRGDSPLVLSQPDDYILKNIRISGLRDMAALTLSGQIRSVTIENSTFGEIWSGPNDKAAAMEAVAASVVNIKVTDTAFYDAENQLLSLRDGSFGTVTFMHCSFKTSEAFLKKIYANDPWRTTPPTTEFYNIQRLELLDNEFCNTTIVIHPSVKTVVFRGDMSKLMIESPDTEVIRLEPNGDPATMPPAAGTALADDAPANDVADGNVPSVQPESKSTTAQAAVVEAAAVKDDVKDDTTVRTASPQTP